MNRFGPPPFPPHVRSLLLVTTLLVACSSDTQDVSTEPQAGSMEPQAGGADEGALRAAAPADVVERWSVGPRAGARARVDAELLVQGRRVASGTYWVHAGRQEPDDLAAYTPIASAARTQEPEVPEDSGGPGAPAAGAPPAEPAPLDPDAEPTGPFFSHWLWFDGIEEGRVGFQVDVRGRTEGGFEYRVYERLSTPLDGRRHEVPLGTATVVLTPGWLTGETADR